MDFLNMSPISFDQNSLDTDITDFDLIDYKQAEIDELKQRVKKCEQVIETLQHIVEEILKRT
jgi:peptidoglycan hydrolase CwlO-like protein